ncbi:MAG: SPOR domain-containing protein [Bacteroidaceae bacterium]
MKELITHIETLLLRNDCVIVPDFGGFLAFNVPAHYVEEELFFLPPMRTVGFNAQLKLNDGLLVQAYMSAYGTTFPDASKRVRKAVKEMIHTLQSEGKLELKGLGLLRVSMDNSYHFTPFLDGLNSPMLYGMGELRIAPMNLLRKPQEDSSTTAEKIHAPKPETKTFTMRPTPKEAEPTRRGAHLWKGIARTAVASAAAIALFFVLSTPVENSTSGQQTYRAEIISSQLFQSQKATPQQAQTQKKEFKQVSSKSVEVESKKDTKKRASQQIESQKPLKIEKATANSPQKEHNTQYNTPSQDKKASVENTNNARKPFSIIVGAFRKKADAERMIAQLIKDGYKNTHLISGSKVHKVCISSYDNENEAITELRTLRAGKHADAWVYKQK